jgi:peptidoglycan/xylan/chitin deacetylase (PgdA/CDA1 family)
VNTFDEDSSEPPETLCDWEDLRELERRGISVQSHSASHPWFSELDSARLEEELTRSKAVLEARLHKRVEVFAYPYGDGGKDVDAVSAALQRSGYRAACLYEGGLNHVPVPNAFRLNRVAMGPETDLRTELGDG